MTTEELKKEIEGLLEKCTFCGKSPVNWDEECDGEGAHEKLGTAILDYQKKELIKQLLSLFTSQQKEMRRKIEGIIGKVYKKYSKDGELMLDQDVASGFMTAIDEIELALKDMEKK